MPRTPRAVAGLAFLFCACAAAGVLAMWFPWQAARQADPRVSANFVDGMQPVSLAFIAGIGLVAGLVAPRHWWLWGFATMAGLVLKIPYDWLSDPTSHNLFPIEVVMYGIMSLPAVLMAFIGSKVRRGIGAAPPATP